MAVAKPSATNKNWSFCFVPGISKYAFFLRLPGTNSFFPFSVMVWRPVRAPSNDEYIGTTRSPK